MTGSVHTGVSGLHGPRVAPRVVRVREPGRGHVMEQTLGSVMRILLVFLMFHVLELELRESHVMLGLVLLGLHGHHGQNVLSHAEEDQEPGSGTAERDGTMETVLVKMRRQSLAMTTNVLPGQNGPSGPSAPSHAGEGREQR